MADSASLAADPVPVIVATTGLAAEAGFMKALTAMGSPVSVIRRVTDLVELLAVARATRTAAVVAVRFPRMSLAVVDELSAAGVRVVMVADRGDDDAERVARQWQLPVVVLAEPDVAAGAVRAALDVPAAPGSTERAGGGGLVLAVCGPAGSPGVTTVAVNLAAGTGDAAVVDLDLAAPSVAFHLGVSEDPSGVLAAAAQAEAGLLDTRRWRSCLQQAPGPVAVASGVGSRARGPEVGVGAVASIMSLSRRSHGLTVLDLGCGDLAEAPSTALADADGAVVVAGVTALALHRLAGWWQRHRDQMPGSVTIVWNGVRSPRRHGGLGRDPAARLAAVVDALGIRGAMTTLPWDPRAAAAMDRSPGPLSLVAPHSGLSRALARLAAEVPARAGEHKKPDPSLYGSEGSGS